MIEIRSFRIHRGVFLVTIPYGSILRERSCGTTQHLNPSLGHMVQTSFPHAPIEKETAKIIFD